MNKEQKLKTSEIKTPGICIGKLGISSPNLIDAADAGQEDEALAERKNNFIIDNLEEVTTTECGGDNEKAYAVLEERWNTVELPKFQVNQNVQVESVLTEQCELVLLDNAGNGRPTDCMVSSSSSSSSSSSPSCLFVFCFEVLYISSLNRCSFDI
jgi:hypothetical protein